MRMKQTFEIIDLPQLESLDIGSLSLWGFRNHTNEYGLLDTVFVMEGMCSSLAQYEICLL